MNYPPMVLGVRHTGNRALRQALGLGSHRHPDHPDLAAQLKRHKHLIVPLREPLSLVLSWYRRPRGKRPKFVVTEFEELTKATAQAEEVHYVCMDRYPEPRTAQLKAVSERYGLTLHPIDPPPITPLFVPPEVLSALYEYVYPVYSMPGIREFYRCPGPGGVREVIDLLASERRIVDTFGCMRAVYDLETGQQKR